MSVLGPVDYVLLIVDLCIEVCALFILLRKKALSKHFTLVLFLSASIAVGIGRYFVLVANGFTSNTYLYFYFFSDALLIISLYLSGSLLPTRRLLFSFLQIRLHFPG